MLPEEVELVKRTFISITDWYTKYSRNLFIFQEKFWPGIVDAEEQVMTARKRYSFPFGFTHHAFFIAMAACTRFCRPLLLWQRGLVWHQGAVEMVLILQADEGR